MKALGFGATQTVVRRCLLAAQRRRSPCPTRIAAAFVAARRESTFRSFDLDPALAPALSQSGFQQPSPIQELGIEPLLQGQDVVLAAETGSGKTLAYLLPIMTHIQAEKRQLLTDANAQISENEADRMVHDALQGKPHRKAHRYAMILCPSVDLCQQVQSVITAFSEAAAMELTSEVSPAGMSRYSRRPDLLLGTPGSILTALNDMEKLVADRILDGVGYVVVDEADLLLSGSYRNQVDQLFQMMYRRERLMAVRSLCASLGLSEEAFLTLPRHVRKAGITDGVRGMVEAGYVPSEASIVMEAPSPFWRRQFILAGATIPSVGTKNTRDEIQQLFPNAKVITTENLHRPVPHLSYDWIEISPKTRMDALLAVIQNDPTFQNRSQGKILIFAKDTNAVEAVERFLTEHEVECVPYHKKLGGMYRRANLDRFRKEQGIAMVCTDGMSRGMDVEWITHVIQAYFAPSAIAFVHRVGRTGRAGRAGKVTSLCTENNKDLAEAIRDCMEAETPVEGAFSRNRSFRKKFRRYGKFVPRGTTPKGEGCDETACPI